MASRDDIYNKTADEGESGLKELLRANADINTPDRVTPAPPSPLCRSARQ